MSWSAAFQHMLHRRSRRDRHAVRPGFALGLAFDRQLPAASACAESATGDAASSPLRLSDRCRHSSAMRRQRHGDARSLAGTARAWRRSSTGAPCLLCAAHADPLKRYGASRCSSGVQIRASLPMITAHGGAVDVVLLASIPGTACRSIGRHASSLAPWRCRRLGKTIADRRRRRMLAASTADLYAPWRDGDPAARMRPTLWPR